MFSLTAVIFPLRGSITRTFLSLHAVQMRLPLRLQQTLKITSGCMSSRLIRASPVPTFQIMMRLSHPDRGEKKKLLFWSFSHRFLMLKMITQGFLCSALAFNISYLRLAEHCELLDATSQYPPSWSDPPTPRLAQKELRWGRSQGFATPLWQNGNIWIIIITLFGFWASFLWGDVVKELNIPLLYNLQSRWQWHDHCAGTSQCPARGLCDHKQLGRPCQYDPSARQEAGTESMNLCLILHNCDQQSLFKMHISKMLSGHLIHTQLWLTFCRGRTRKAPPPLASTIIATNLGFTAQKALSQVTRETLMSS